VILAAALENATSFPRAFSKILRSIALPGKWDNNAVSHVSELVIESPAPGQNVSDEALFITGSIKGAELNAATCVVRAIVNGECCGETRLLFPTTDPGRLGFRILGRVPAQVGEPRDVTLRVVAESISAAQTIRVVPASLRERPYGDVVHPDNETLLHRENIYGSGPPIEEPGIEVAELLRAYLPAGSSVLDVGCGAGAYGAGLRACGHDWLGLEANAHCCDILARRQLPFRRVDSDRLPVSDAEFDCAICIEVVEHTKDPAMFVSEIARVVRRRALFSVPNMELLPYLHDWRVVPWHLLEGDHKNFFTRASLRALLARHFSRVEIFPYGEHPLRTRDGVPLYVHLFAIADT
jgi:SAM-dependent methyltransferase